MISWKRTLLIVIIIAFTFIIVSNFYYEEILPYKVMENTFSLNSQTSEIDIDYHDPDISYRAMQFKVSLTEGEPVEIVYVQCSDDAYITLNEGSTSFVHNIGFFLRIRLVNPNGWANGSYTIFDRTSFFVPKSATKACTAIPKIAYYFYITFFLMILGTFGVFTYILAYRRDLIRQLFQKKDL